MRYAVISPDMGVVNVIELSEGSGWQPPEGHTVVKTDIGNIGDIYKDGSFIKQAPAAQDVKTLSAEARIKRDFLLSSVYDAATQVIRREIDLSSDSAKTKKLKAKLVEFHAYAVLLQDVPSQDGFPKKIKWPEQPSGELE